MKISLPRFKTLAGQQMQNVSKVNAFPQNQTLYDSAPQYHTKPRPHIILLPSARTYIISISKLRIT